MTEKPQKKKIECRYCDEELRFIEGAWIDAETYSICADGRKHEPPVDVTLAPEQWHEVFDWCRQIQQLAQKVSERVDAFANAIPDKPIVAEVQRPEERP